MLDRVVVALKNRGKFIQSVVIVNSYQWRVIDLETCVFGKLSPEREG